MMLEREIQKQLLEWLKLQGVFAWRCSLGGVRHAGVGMKKNPMSGFPDIAGIIPGGKGQLFVVEAKTTIGKLSPNQIKWRHDLESRGVLYILARTTADLRPITAGAA